MTRLTQYLIALISLGFTHTVFGQQDANTRHFLLRDEGLSKLNYVDLGHPEKNWQVAVPTGRDLQLVGNGRVLIGTSTGYEEREIASGNKLYELTSFKAIIAARRLRNGNTMLVGLGPQDKPSIVLTDVDAKGNTQRVITFPVFNYVRLVRETPKGTLLVTTNTKVFEANVAGEILWQATLSDNNNTHAWQALRLANGNTIVSGGYTGNFQVFDPAGQRIQTITGPEKVMPKFYAGFQILSNGNLVVTNWQGHGPNFGAVGTQLLEYSPKGELVWSWQQDATRFSSLQGVIVLDGLDTNLLHIENENGILAPLR